MSGYTPRRGPNMNQYISNLNSLPTSGEAAAVPDAGYPNLDDELSLFTNVEFLNEFDLGDSVDGGEALGSAKSAATDGNFDDGFQFPYMAGDSMGSMPFNVPYTPTSVAHPSHYAASGLSGAGPQPGEKRPASAANSSASPDGETRVAAEEDKRRRNTAASARFRVKKKQREQALERTAKDMTDRTEKLEARVSELEQENKFLRSLVVEKAGATGAAPDAADGVLRKVAADARKADSSKRGIGTKAA